MTRRTQTARRRARLRPFRFDQFASGESRLISATFTDLLDARRAVRDLEARAYPANEISVLMTDEARKHHLRTHPEFEGFDPDVLLVDQVEIESDRKTLKGMGTGGAIGAALGALTAALTAAGAAIIIAPGVVIAGPLAAAFAGAGAGGAVGGLVGGLTGAGMSEYRAKELERVVRAGKVIVMARARTFPELEQIRQCMAENGGTLVLEDPTS